ncbi:MAG: WecB/TagA/CpsF family glycosyltransferase, partial [Candidatus Promineifilaceae bacterium]
WLRDFLNEANIVFCDGAGVIIGARILGKHIPERITYADWLYQFSEFSETQDFSLFFLGAKPGVADDAARHLVSIHPNLRIVGTQHGYFDKTASSQENEEIIAKINEAKPNILILGFGMPLQERWLMDNWHTVDANVALTGGAVFDYLSGRLSRAPGWMTDNSLEWLGRLVVEPKRLWRRYLVGNPLFMWRVLNERLLGEARQ